MCIRDRLERVDGHARPEQPGAELELVLGATLVDHAHGFEAVSYTHLRAHETVLDLVCRLLLEKNKQQHTTHTTHTHTQARQQNRI